MAQQGSTLTANWVRGSAHRYSIRGGQGGAQPARRSPVPAPPNVPRPRCRPSVARLMLCGLAMRLHGSRESIRILQSTALGPPPPVPNDCIGKITLTPIAAHPSINSPSCCVDHCRSCVISGRTWLIPRTAWLRTASSTTAGVGGTCAVPFQSACSKVQTNQPFVDASDSDSWNHPN